MNDLPTNLQEPKNNDIYNLLVNSTIPEILLPNQDDNLLKLYRHDTFRIVLFCYPMTGHPDQPLPKNWDIIPGAKGCTAQHCSFRDNYDNLIKLNALPIGVSTQSIADIKEMTIRLQIPYDVLSDRELILSSKINLENFSIGKRKFYKRATLIIEKTVIKKFFYPIFPANKHIFEVLNWLEKN